MCCPFCLQLTARCCRGLGGDRQGLIGEPTSDALSDAGVCVAFLPAGVWARAVCQRPYNGNESELPTWREHQMRRKASMIRHSTVLSVSRAVYTESRQHVSCTSHADSSIRFWEESSNRIAFRIGHHLIRDGQTVYHMFDTSTKYR